MDWYSGSASNGIHWLSIEKVSSLQIVATAVLLSLMFGFMKLIQLCKKYEVVRKHTKIRDSRSCLNKTQREKFPCICCRRSFGL